MDPQAGSRSAMSWLSLQLLDAASGQPRVAAAPVL